MSSKNCIGYYSSYDWGNFGCPKCGFQYYSRCTLCTAHMAFGYKETAQDTLKEMKEWEHVDREMWNKIN